MKKAKMVLLGTLVSGAALFQGGCLNLGGFWNGLFNSGWPTENRVLNIAIDVINEELFG